MQILKNVIRDYVKKHILLLLAFLLLSMAISVLSSLLPSVLGVLVNVITQEISTSEEIKVTPTFIILVYILSSIGIAIAKYVYQLMFCKIQANMSFDYNKSAISLVHNAQYKFTRDLDPNYMTQRINGDCNEITSFLLTIVQNCIQNTFAILISLFFIFTYSFALTMLSLGSIVISALVYIFYRKEIYKSILCVKERMDKYFSELLSMLTQLKFIKIFNYSERKIRRLQFSFCSVFQAVMKKQRKLCNYEISESIINIILIGASYLIGYKQIEDSIKPLGDFIIIVTYIPVFQNSVNYFINLGSQCQSIKVCINRMLEIEKLPKESNGDISILNINSLMFKDVQFNYGNKMIINGLTQNISTPGIVGVFGNNGAGKTTLVDIISGLYSEEIVGKILINGYEAKDIKKKDLLGKHIEVLLQTANSHYFLSYVDRLMQQDLDTAYISDLCKSFRIDISKIMRSITEQSELSGGEKQKIALLSVFANKEADLIILDEPSNDIDRETKDLLINHINRISQHKIVILISHDPEMINLCDHLIRL